MPKLPQAPGDTTILAGMGGQFLPINFNGETLCLENCFNQWTWASGWYDAVGYYAGGVETLTDNGAGTTIVANSAVNLTVLNFASDPIGKVVLANETDARAPILWDDGNGGSVLSTWSGGRIHFVGEVVPMSQIISSVAPTMAFVAPAPVVAAAAPAAPTPAPAPAADPTITAPGTYIGSGQGGTADGATFALNGDNQNLTLLSSNNNVVSLNANSDSISATSDNGLTINAIGQGTHLALCACASVTVNDFDATDTVQLLRQAAQPIIQPDGSGGTLLTFGTTGGVVHFVGAVVTADRVVVT